MALQRKGDWRVKLDFFENGLEDLLDHMQQRSPSLGDNCFFFVCLAFQVYFSTILDCRRDGDACLFQARR